MAENSVNKKPAKRWRRTIRNAALGLLAAAFVLLVFAAGSIFFILQADDNQEWLRERLEAAINERLGEDYTAKIKSAYLSSLPGGVIGLQASDIELKDKDGNLFVSAKDGLISTRLNDLVFGRITIDRISLVNTIARVKRGAQVSAITAKQEKTLSELIVGSAGSTLGNSAILDPFFAPDVDSGLATLESASEEEPEALALLAKGLESAAKAFDLIEKTDLGRLQLDDLALFLINDSGKALQSLEIIQARLFPLEKQEGSASSYGIEVETMQRGRKGVQLAFSYHRPSEGEDRAFQFEIDNIWLNNFIERLNDPKYAVKVDLPFALSGTFVLTNEPKLRKADIAVFAREGTVTTGDKSTFPVSGAHLQLSLNNRERTLVVNPSPFQFGPNRLRPEGTIRLPQKLMDPYPFEFHSTDNYFNSPDVPEEPVSVAFISSKGAFQPRHKVISLTEVKTKSDLLSLTGSASFGFEGRTPSLAAAAQIGPMDVDVMKQVWPIFIAPSARNWSIKNLHQGRFEGGNFYASVPPGVLGNLRKGAFMHPEEMQFDFKVANASFHPFGEFPDVEDANLTGSIRGISLAIDVEKGATKSDEGGTVGVSTGRFAIEDFRFPGPTAEISFEAAGKAEDIGNIADKKPVLALERARMQPEGLTGDVVANINVKVPLRPRLKAGEVIWDAKLDVKDFSSPRPIDGRQIEKADATVNINPVDLTIVGTGVIDGIEADIDFSQPLDRKGEDAKVAVKVNLSDEDRRKLKLGLDDYLKGPIAVSIEQLADGTKGESSYNIDLTSAEIRLDFLGWRKSKGVPASASLKLLNTKNGTQVSDFNLTGEGFKARGDVDLSKEGTITSLTLKEFALSAGDSVAVSMKLRGGKTFDISIEGRQFDARSLIKKITDTPKDEPQSSYRYNISTNIGRVIGYRNVSIKNFSSDLLLRGSTILRFAAGGSTSESANNFTISYGSRNDGTDVLTAEGTDAGALFRFSNVYWRAYGGFFKLVGERPAGQKAMNGTYRMNNFILLEEPALKGITASKDAQGRSAVRFNVLDVRFSEENSRLSLTKGLLSGDEIGGTYRGVLNRETRGVNFTGTYVPAYVLNNFFSKIPIVGPIIGNGREGLIGVTFKVTGNIGSPNVVINPLSALAPGFLRQIFRFRQAEEQKGDG